MSEAFRVDPQALADAVQQMAEFTRHAESIIAEIDFLVSNLHAAWPGDAAAAHAEAHRHWALREHGFQPIRFRQFQSRFQLGHRRPIRPWQLGFVRLGRL